RNLARGEVYARGCACLLDTCRERPRSRSTKKGNELASSHMTSPESFSTRPSNYSTLRLLGELHATTGPRRSAGRASRSFATIPLPLSGCEVRSGCAPCEGGAFQWVQAPPGNRSSRKQPEQLWR